MLWMEPSAGCNLDCPGCPTAAGRLGGVMRYKNFLHVINQMPWLKLINLWHRGEPLVCVDLPEMIAEATRRGIRTQTHSNGILLTKKNRAEELVRAGLTRIGIGIDGPDNETYKRLRVGGTLEEVEAGIRALVEAKLRLKSRYPKIAAECLLSDQTPEQFEAVKRLAFEWGCEEVRYKTYKVPDPKDIERSMQLLPEDERLWRYNRRNGHLVMKRNHTACWRLAYSAVVAWNGDVYPCCFDALGEFNMGNAFEESWKSIWKGDRFADFQRKVNSDRDAIKMCRNCTEGLPKLYIPHRLVLK